MANETLESGGTRDRVRALREQGLTNRQISAALGISTQAVWKHVKRIEDEEAKAS